MRFRKSRWSVTVFAFLIAGLPSWSRPVKILVNHVGDEPAGSKRAVVQGRLGQMFDDFTVRELATGEAVLSGKVRFVGPVQKWKDWVFGTVDFSPLSEEGG